jgi:hypothetical protein
MGWDGDDLAGKMEEALEQQQAAQEARRNQVYLSPEQRAQNAEHESVRLSIARIKSQLESTTNPGRRAMLERALASLEQQESA